MYYLVSIKHLSSGSVERNITPYEDETTALRKFHEVFNVIGAGPTSITAILLEESMFTGVNENNEIVATKITGCNIVKQETWSVQIDVQPAESEA